MTNENMFTLKFPSVTICNLNIVHCGNLYAMIEECEKVKYNAYLEKLIVIVLIINNMPVLSQFIDIGPLVQATGAVL